MSSETLKPCPFCGGNANRSYAGAHHMTGCADCEVVTPSYVTRKMADEAWNTRHEPLTDKADNYPKCFVCQMPLSDTLFCPKHWRAD